MYCQKHGENGSVFMLHPEIVSRETKRDLLGMLKQIS
jgi:hypothetical protein